MLHTALRSNLRYLLFYVLLTKPFGNLWNSYMILHNLKYRIDQEV
jgi:hypothetical protein